MQGANGLVTEIQADSAVFLIGDSALVHIQFIYISEISFFAFHNGLHLGQNLLCFFSTVFQ